MNHLVVSGCTPQQSGSTGFNFFGGLTPLGADRLARMNTLKESTSCHPLNTQILSNAHSIPFVVIISNNCSGEKQFIIILLLPLVATKCGQAIMVTIGGGKGG